MMFSYVTPHRLVHVDELVELYSYRYFLHFNSHFSRWTCVSQLYCSYGWWKW